MAPPTEVTVHPLVLLSVTDHFYRVAKDTRNRRVVGILLGTVARDGSVQASNAYAVPFEEDAADPDVWFLDHNYHEHMFAMFRKVAARERVVGWYSTGPRIRSNDIKIHQVLRMYCADPVFVIVDVRGTDSQSQSQPQQIQAGGGSGPQQRAKIPTDAYVAVEQVKPETFGEKEWTFAHIPSEIGAVEAEEIGVEHLLRDVKDTTVSSLSTQVTERMSSLAQLEVRLKDIRTYLDRVLSEELPVNHAILYKLQDVLNLLPNLKIGADEQMVKALTTRTNDRLAVVYLSAMIRAVVALHELIGNKIGLKEHEAKALLKSGGGISNKDLPIDANNQSGESPDSPAVEKAGGYSK
eukprot:ANDGO_02207.mRNA.1 26S proteasome non-ATPase regulatory subunit 7 homolog B